MSEYRTSVAIPYIDHLISNINDRFSDTAVKLLVSSSVFDPTLLPTNETSLSEYGKEQVQDLVGFYESEVTIEFEGNTYSSLPLIDGDIH